MFPTLISSLESVAFVSLADFMRSAPRPKWGHKQWNVWIFSVVEPGRVHLINEDDDLKKEESDWSRVLRDDGVIDCLGQPSARIRFRATAEEVKRVLQARADPESD